MGTLKWYSPSNILGAFALALAFFIFFGSLVAVAYHTFIRLFQ